MKKKLIIAAFAAAAFVACDDVLKESETAGEASVQLEVSLPDEVMTRISGSSSEDAVTGLQVFIFDETGSLEAYGTAGAATLSLDCFPGKKKVVALVNAPGLSGISSYTDLTGTRSLLSDNAAGSLVMEGEKEVTLTSSTSVTVPVSRIASRISISSITNAFALEYHKNMTFSLVSVYMINVAGNRNYLTDSAPTTWYNKMKNTSDLPAILYESLGNTTLKSASTYSEAHYFYCYPNHTTADYNDGTWQPRHTRLVVEAKLGTETYYYPVTLPEVDQNTAYDITLKITRPGSDSPDKPVETDAVEVTVQVVDWIDGADINEVI